MKTSNSFYLDFKVLSILLILFIVIPGCAGTILVQIPQEEIQQYQNLKEGSLALRTHRLRTFSEREADKRRKETAEHRGKDKERPARPGDLAADR